VLVRESRREAGVGVGGGERNDRPAVENMGKGEAGDEEEMLDAALTPAKASMGGQGCEGCMSWML
jgi:hypothetical protein